MSRICGLLLGCLLLTGSARADEETVIEETIFQASHFIDTLQTVDIAHRPDRYRESSNFLDSGWVIGSHPTQAHVWQYMGFKAVGHLGITWALEHWQATRWVQRTWQGATIGLSLDCVAHNASVGVSIHF